MIVVKFAPMSNAADGPTKVYHAAAVDFDTARGEVVLTFRDQGRLCFGIVGPWKLAITEEFGVHAHTTDEAERIHNGSALVTVN